MSARFESDGVTGSRIESKCETLQARLKKARDQGIDYAHPGAELTKRRAKFEPMGRWNPIPRSGWLPVPLAQIQWKPWAIAPKTIVSEGILVAGKRALFAMN
jgi:hypothetical protein